jgi:hypothetical protein
MKEGIENIKNCVGFVLDITADLQTALADGKFGLKDSFLFVNDIPQVPKVIRSAAKFWTEFQELDEMEQSEIVDFVIQKLQCNTEKAKDIIVQSFKTAMSINDVARDGIALARIIKAA